MATRQGVVDEVSALVGGAAKERGVRPIATYLDLGLRDVNKYAPRVLKLTITGDGGDEYALTGWDDHFSVVRRVRWVASNDFNATAQWLTPEEYEVEYASDGTAQIRFGSSPSSSDRVVVEFTDRHTLTEVTTTCTLTDDQAAALARRASALLLRAAAASVASVRPQATDADIAFPSESAAGEYRRLADDMDAEFGRLLGVDMTAGAQSGGPVLISVPAQPSRRNARYLTHPRTSASVGDV